ncbi:hypothetical protein FACS1894172_02980 [Spirochaetia bacterium]|nr:hypothetical protein FACS1894172_02980 [Spirochaetia bacterium]
MQKPQIVMFTVLYQYLLIIKEPLYVFLAQTLQHLSPDSWWEKYIAPALNEQNSKDFRYLDLIDLLNILRKNWVAINNYIDKDDSTFIFNDDYKLTTAMLYIRNTVAHAKEIQLSPRDFINYLTYILNFANFIRAKKDVTDKLEKDLKKYKNEISINKDKSSTTISREELINYIEKETLFDAIICETLKPDIKASIIRTVIRLKSMRTIEEIIGFFNGALDSPRGQEVSEELHAHNLKAFIDIKDEVNNKYKVS